MPEAMWRQHDLKDAYDVVIIGGGGHGLATAYYLTQLGVRNVAVLEAKYIGHGGSGRNTAILRFVNSRPEIVSAPLRGWLLGLASTLKPIVASPEPAADVVKTTHDTLLKADQPQRLESAISTVAGPPPCSKCSCESVMV